MGEGGGELDMVGEGGRGYERTGEGDRGWGRVKKQMIVCVHMHGNICW